MIGLDAGCPPFTGRGVTVAVLVRMEVVEDAARREHAKHALVEGFGMQNVNDRRLERYGVLTGEVDAERVAAIRGLDFVESVEADATRRAL